MADVEAQGGLGRKDGKLTVGIWLGLSTGWATVAIDRPPAALGAPHAPCISYLMQCGKRVNTLRLASSELPSSAAIGRTLAASVATVLASMRCFDITSDAAWPKVGIGAPSGRVVGVKPSSECYHSREMIATSQAWSLKNIRGAVLRTGSAAPSLCAAHLVPSQLVCATNPVSLPGPTHVDKGYVSALYHVCNTTHYLYTASPSGIMGTGSFELVRGQIRVCLGFIDDRAVFERLGDAASVNLLCPIAKTVILTRCRPHISRERFAQKLEKPLEL